MTEERCRILLTRAMSVFAVLGLLVCPLFAQQGRSKPCGDNPLTPTPFDLHSDSTDLNGFSDSPTWGTQHPPSYDPPHTKGMGESKFVPPCTTQRTSNDVADICAEHGHVNWFPATYEGTVFWNHLSTDQDNDLRLLPDKKLAGVTNANSPAGELSLEFDSEETTDRFITPWWKSFVSLSDQQKHVALCGRRAVVVGLFGVDCAHGCHSELHPVYVIAINVKSSASDDQWSIFVRTNGDEGFCSTFCHRLESEEISVVLPTDQEVAPEITSGTMFAGWPDSGMSWPKATFIPKTGLLLNFTLIDYRKNPIIEGELHLKWARPFKGDMPGCSPPKPEVEKDTPDGQMTLAVAGMDKEKRNDFWKRRATLGLPSLKPIPMPSAYSVQVSQHLPSPKQPPNASTEQCPDVQARNRDLLRLVCEIKGGSVKGLNCDKKAVDLKH
jgi:hypothetical protein